MLEIILLSVIQGITEFLPISSSAHLILISQYLNFDNENLTLDVSLHIGSLIAVIFFFKKEILNFTHNKKLFYKILAGSLPTIIVGYLLVKLNLIELFRNIYVIAISTIFFGIILYLSDKSKELKNVIDHLSLKNTIFIGLFQILSLIPGVSRSGITITAARFLKFNRIEAAKVSFLLSIPTLIAVSSYNIFKIIELKNIQLTIDNFSAIIFAFVFSLITLKYLIKFLKKFSFLFFVIYRIILGIVIMFSIYAY